MENPNVLITAATPADGYAEPEAALLMLADKHKSRSRRITMGANMAYGTKDLEVPMSA